MKVTIEPKGKRYIMLRLGIGPIYAEKGGKACLRNETSWRKLSGFWVNTSLGCFWFELRRVHP